LGQRRVPEKLNDTERIPMKTYEVDAEVVVSITLTVEAESDEYIYEEIERALPDLTELSSYASSDVTLLRADWY